MTDQQTSSPGWAFLVARGRHRGYRSILVPDFLAELDEYGVLTEKVRGGHDPSSGPRTERIMTASAGQMSLTYRTHRVVHADLDPEPSPDGRDAYTGGRGELVTDEHGRPLDLLYGFVSRSLVSREANEADLLDAKGEALSAYRHFLDDESDFTVETSRAFPLRSRTSRADVGPPVPSEGERATTPLRQRRTFSASSHVLGFVIAIICAAILITAAMMWLRPRSSDIDVPDRRECELQKSGRDLACIMDIRVSVKDPTDLASVEATIDSSSDRVDWTVDRRDCETDNKTTCTIEVTVEALEATDQRELTARLTVEASHTTRTVQLEAKSG